MEADTTADYALPPDADAASIDSAMTRGSYAAGSLKKVSWGAPGGTAEPELAPCVSW